MPRSNAGGVGELAGVPAQKCFVVQVDLGITIGTGTRAVGRAFRRHPLDVDMPAGSRLATGDETILKDTANIAVARGVPQQVKLRMETCIKRHEQPKVQDS